MPSSFSQRLRLELQATGENAGIWGTVLNSQMGSLLETAIAGYRVISMPDTDYTLSSLNGADDEARYAVLAFTGTLTATRSVIVPMPSKLYQIMNSTNHILLVKTALGAGVPVPPGRITPVFSNGMDVLSLTDYLPTLTAATLNGTNLTVTGNATLGDAGTDTTTIISQVQANGTVGATGQILASRGAGLSPEWVNPPNNTGGGATGDVAFVTLGGY